MTNTTLINLGGSFTRDIRVIINENCAVISSVRMVQVTALHVLKSMLLIMQFFACCACTVDGYHVQHGVGRK